MKYCNSGKEWSDDHRGSDRDSPCGPSGSLFPGVVVGGPDT